MHCNSLKSLGTCAISILVVIGTVLTILLCVHTYYLRREVKALYMANEEAMYAKLASLLTVYSVSDQNGPLSFFRMGRDHDGGYIVPDKALKMADALLGYGLADDISFEEQFSNRYHKPSYGYDCGVDAPASTTPLFHFTKECITTDSTLYGSQQSSKNVATFRQQLEKAQLMNKQLFIKMDIEGAEYAAFEDILPYASQITGIVVEIHFAKATKPNKAIKLLSNLRKDFILTHVHGNNCSPNSYFTAENAIGRIPRILELTYINKSLVTNHHIAANQKHPLSMDMPNVPQHQEATFEIITE